VIDGAHVVLYSTDPEADVAALRDVLAFRYIDVGNGRLHFALPQTEVAVHDTDGPPQHELYLMCDDLDATLADLTSKGITATEIQNPGWGLVTTITLPGGSQLGLYQPRHARLPQD
jgi:hypothetical protein